MIKSKQDLEDRGIEIDLSGPDGNAFVLMGMASRWLKQMGTDPEPIIEEMKSGDYDNLVAVMEREFGDVVTFYR